MDTKQLIQTLKTYPSYQQLTEYYIRKEIGKKYNTKRAKNDQLRLELDQLQQVAQQSILVNDVRLNIYQHLDIDEIIHACYTDKYAVKLCSTKSFWDNVFVKYNLPVPVENYKHVNEWIMAFTREILFTRSKKIIYLPHSFYIYSMAIGFGIYITQKYTEWVSRSIMLKGLMVYFGYPLDAKFKSEVLI